MEDCNAGTVSLSDSDLDPNDSSYNQPQSDCDVDDPQSPERDLLSTNSCPTKLPFDFKTESLQQDVVKLEAKVIQCVKAT